MYEILNGLRVGFTHPIFNYWVSLFSNAVTLPSKLVILPFIVVIFPFISVISPFNVVILPFISVISPSSTVRWLLIVSISLLNPLNRSMRTLTRRSLLSLKGKSLSWISLLCPCYHLWESNTVRFHSINNYFK